MALHLYQLSEAYAILQAAAEEDEEEGAFERALVVLGGELTEKIESICKLIRILEADATAAEAEAKRLSALARSRLNRVATLKQYLFDNLEAAHLDRIDGKLFKVALQASPPSCNILDFALIPEAYHRIIPERREPDRTALLRDLKDGAEIPGAELVRSRHLRIR